MHIVPSYDAVQPDKGLVESRKMLLLVISKKNMLCLMRSVYFLTVLCYLYTKNFGKKDG